MFKPHSARFYVTISPQKARTSCISHCIEEALRAYSGYNTSVSIEQMDDTTLEIIITQAVEYREASGGQPYTSTS